MIWQNLRGWGWSVYDEARDDICGCEGEGGRGRSVDEQEARGEMCGGEWGGGGRGLVDKVAHDTWRGEGGGGGISMDNAFANISELRRLGRPRSWHESLNSGAYGDACDGNWGGVNRSHKAWSNGE